MYSRYVPKQFEITSLATLSWQVMVAGNNDNLTTSAVGADTCEFSDVLSSEQDEPHRDAWTFSEISRMDY
jgi:hypothetical protein